MTILNFKDIGTKYKKKKPLSQIKNQIQKSTFIISNGFLVVVEVNIESGMVITK